MKHHWEDLSIAGGEKGRQYSGVGQNHSLNLAVSSDAREISYVGDEDSMPGFLWGFVQGGGGGGG